jgi:SAM-dependent methyltransferase
MAELFESDLFYTELYPYIFTEKRFRDSIDELDKALNLSGIKEGNLLDLCCGPGRHAVYAAQKGFSVTGVDGAKFLLDMAKKHAEKNKVGIEWIKEDMRKFLRPDFFNIAIMMYTSLGHNDNKNDDIKVLGNIYKSLKPGGKCFLEMVGKEILAKNFQPAISVEHPDGSLMIHHHKIIDDWTRVQNKWIHIKNGNTKNYTFQHTVYSGQELKDRLKIAGFAEVILYGTFDGDEYGPDAKRLIAIGTKD